MGLHLNVQVKLFEVEQTVLGFREPRDLRQVVKVADLLPPLAGQARGLLHPHLTLSVVLHFKQH